MGLAGNRMTQDRPTLTSEIYQSAIFTLPNQQD